MDQGEISEGQQPNDLVQAVGRSLFTAAQQCYWMSGVVSAFVAGDCTGQSCYWGSKKVTDAML